LLTDLTVSTGVKLFDGKFELKVDASDIDNYICLGQHFGEGSYRINVSDQTKVFLNSDQWVHVMTVVNRGGRWSEINNAGEVITANMYNTLVAQKGSR
jgi:hypothetical protein